MDLGKRFTRRRQRSRVVQPLLAAIALAVAAGAGIKRFRGNRDDKGRRSTMLEANKEIARRALIEIFDKGRMEIVDELISDGYVGHDSAMDQPVSGPDGVKQSAAGYRGAFPDLAFKIEEQIAEGDSVVTRWTARGTHEGELFGIAPTGKETTVTGITINRIIDSKIVEARTNWDTLGLLQQIGAVPTLARA